MIGRQDLFHYLCGIKLKYMNIKELKEQLQNDILTILEGFGVDGALEGAEYNSMVSALCDAVINNVNKLKQ
jgi:hypothetical protein